jgi:hypothetical protein
MSKNFGSRIDSLRDSVSAMSIIERDQPITPDMTGAQAEKIYMNLLKRNGKKARKAAEEASRLVLTADEEQALADKYAATLQVDHKANHFTWFCLKMLVRWKGPEVYDTSMPERVKILDRLDLQMVKRKVGPTARRWVINQVAGCLSRRRRPEQLPESWRSEN